MPQIENVFMEQEKEDGAQEESKETVLNRPGPAYEQELKEVSGIDASELSRKRMFME